MIVFGGVDAKTQLFFFDLVHLHIYHDDGCLFAIESI